MKIGYDNNKLKKLCLTSKAAVKELGTDSARKLRARLADIEAHTNVSELHAGRPHPLRGDRFGQFSLDLAGGDRLIFKPEQVPPPIKKDVGIDWKSVESIIIIFIGDHHE